jgi:hypothetical protein
VFLDISNTTYDNGMMNVGAAAGVPDVMSLTSFVDVLPGGIIHSRLLIEEYIVGRNG